MTDRTQKLIVVSSHRGRRPLAKTGYWIGDVSHFAEVVQQRGLGQWLNVRSCSSGRPSAFMTKIPTTGGGLHRRLPLERAAGPN